MADFPYTAEQWQDHLARPTALDWANAVVARAEEQEMAPDDDEEMR